MSFMDKALSKKLYIHNDVIEKGNKKELKVIEKIANEIKEEIK